MIEKRIVRRDTSGLTGSFSPQMHPLLQRVYLGRGVASDRDLVRELSALQDPAALKGVSAAVERLTQAVMLGEKVVIVGDFDADGATSTALAVLALERLGLPGVGFVVPNRFEYGYGLTPEIVAVAARQQPELIITVDNGISSIDGVAAANALGIDVIVTDHHLPGPELPAAAAIVNPNQPGCTFVSKALAGVGVVFYVMIALRVALREQGWFTRSGQHEPNLGDLLDLVALGTVADVVPLDQLNRLLVHQGLMRIRRRQCRPGILALLEVGKRSPEYLNASDLGFAIAPRLNAAGRMDDMSLGIACLLAENLDSARDMAQELDMLNQDRRQIEQTMQQEALGIIDRLHLDDSGLPPPAICVYDPQWHQGVIGIVASRIKDRFHRPVIAFAPAENQQELKGSARSIPGVHMRDLLDAVAARHPGLLSKFGGHAMAAGLVLAPERLEVFQQALAAEVVATVRPEDLQAQLLTDGELAPEDFNLYTAQLLQNGGPWGQHFPEPCFEGGFQVVQQKVLAEKHVKLVLSLPGQPQSLLDAICFNADLSFWRQQPEQVRLIYRLDINRFRGKENLQLMVDHAEHMP